MLIMLPFFSNDGSLRDKHTTHGVGVFVVITIGKKSLSGLKYHSTHVHVLSKSVIHFFRQRKFKSNLAEKIHLYLLFLDSLKYFYRRYFRYIISAYLH